MEEGFFNILGSLVQPFFQGLMIVGGLLCALPGAALLGDWLWWRMRAVARTGRVIGVKDVRGTYYPVWRYETENGAAFEATGDAGSSSLRGMETGREEQILVFPQRPGRAKKARDMAQMLAGIGFLAPGVALLAAAFTRYPVDGLTWATLAVFLAYFARKCARLLPSRRLGPAALRELRAMRRAASDMQPVLRAEDAMTDPKIRRRAARQEGARMLAGPLFLISGLAALAGGIYLGGAAMGLETEGLRAEGAVAELAAEAAENGRMLYHPVVRFRDAAGREYSFTDKTGARTPAYGEGEEVGVLYLAENPETSAEIDRGFYKWLPPGFLCVFGLLSLALGVSLMPRQRDEAR